MGEILEDDRINTGELLFRKLIEHSYAGVTLLDRGLNVHYRSPSAERITGWNSVNLAEQTSTSLVHPDDGQLVQRVLKEVIARPGEPVTARFRTRHYNGHYIWIECTLTNLLDEPEVDAIVFNFVEVTSQVEQAEQLRQSGERFALIAKATQDALFEWDVKTGFIWWSESHYTMFGFDPSEPIPPREVWLQCLHRDARLHFEQIAADILDGSITQWETEVTYRRPGGGWGVLLARGFAVCDTQQKATKMLGSFIDMTERRNAESQRELLAAISRPFREDNRLQTILGSTTKALQQFSSATTTEIWLLSPDASNLALAARSGEPPATNNLAQEARASGERYYRAIGKNAIGIILYHYQEPVGVVLLYLDSAEDLLKLQPALTDRISAQLGMEIRHQQMAEQLRLLFDRAPDMIGILGTDRCFKKANPAMCKLLEYSEQELLNLSLDKLVHPDDLESSRERTKAFIQGGDQTLYFENRFLSKSGKAIWLSWTASRSAEEGVLFCIGKNISDKKEMENLLHKANELARIGSWEVDRVKGTAYWSAITREIYEVPETFVPNSDNWLSFYREGADRDYIAGKMANTIATGQPCDAEVELVTALGNKRWVRAMAEAEFRNGECVRIYGSFQDIDNRKKAELAATRALAERNTILESIGDGFFAVDRNWIITYWNATAEKTLGNPREAMLGKYFWDMYEDVRDLDFYDHYQHAMRTGKVVHFEDFYPPMQTWFGVSAYPSEHGLSVFFKDITESKKTVQSLAESEKRYSDLFQLSPQPMFVYDMDTLGYLDVNTAAITHYGYSREEFLTMTISDIRPTEDIPLLQQTVAQQQDEQVVKLHGIFRHRKKNGELIQVDIQSNRITYQGIKAKVVLANDVTERVHYIRAIEAQNEKLREISWMQSHVIRAPLARIMGLMPLLGRPGERDPDLQLAHDYLVASANELDQVIRSITDVTAIVKVN